MKLSSSFTVPAESTLVFAHFLDPDSMRVSVPGCTELERVDDTHYRGRLVNEIAHVRFSAGFTAEITSLRAPEEVHAVLRGEDRRLGSSIKIDATLTVRPAEGASDEGASDEGASTGDASDEGASTGDASGGVASQVGYSLQVSLWGKIGRLGESIVRRRSQDVEREFVAAFAELCASGPPGQRPATPAAPPTGRTPQEEASTAVDTLTPPRPAPAAARRAPWWRRLLNTLLGRAGR
jgi:carbon monoxide dehydrogenase subunit G